LKMLLIEFTPHLERSSKAGKSSDCYRILSESGGRVSRERMVSDWFIELPVSLTQGSLPNTKDIYNTKEYYAKNDYAFHDTPAITLFTGICH
jgi:hypothetical protein